MNMPEFFGRQFSNIDTDFLQELRNLSAEGCIYTRLWRDEIDEFGFCRIQFRPEEIVKYVDSLDAYDEFQGYVDQGNSADKALDNISNNKIKRRVRDYNEWTEDIGQPETKFSPAAFLTDELESLVCGGKPDRYEFLQESYTGDRRFLLTEIIEGFHQSVSILNDRDGDRPSFEITCEQDVQDLLFAIMKPIFPDSRPEEYTPKHATTSKRIDFVIPEISTVIEAKYVRGSSHISDLPDELKIDIESYHKHTDCSQMIGVVWDGDSHISDRANFEKDLTGPRTIDGTEFQVEVRVIP